MKPVNPKFFLTFKIAGVSMLVSLVFILSYGLFSRVFSFHLENRAESYFIAMITFPSIVYLCSLLAVRLKYCL
jgi:ABC-type spermidine/putrescine transport system permease subunit II